MTTEKWVIGETSTRRRSLPFHKSVGDQWYAWSWPSAYENHTPYPLSIVGRQETVSTNTAWPVWQRLLRSKYVDHASVKRQISEFDLGSAFQTKKHTYSDNSDELPGRYVTGSRSAGIEWGYSGPIFARSGQVDPGSGLWPDLSPPDLIIMSAAGTTAIKRTVPNNPVASVAQFLGELREGLPHMVGKSVLKAAAGKNLKQLLRAGGDEFLNVTFGILPFVSDIEKMVKASTDADRILKDFLEGVGRNIYRRYDFRPTTVKSTTFISSGYSGYPALPGQMYPGYSPNGKLSVTRETTTEMWFEGVYTYSIPEGTNLRDSLVRHLELADKLAGVQPNFRVLWELLPWSWASDWFFDVGDIVSNLTAFSSDGLVMRRGYIMRHDRMVDTYTLEGLTVAGQTLPPIIQSFGTEYKTRMKATPYGFGYNMSGLSPTQLAILGSLGLTRGLK